MRVRGNEGESFRSREYFKERVMEMIFFYFSMVGFNFLDVGFFVFRERIIVSELIDRFKVFVERGKVEFLVTVVL